MPPRLLLRQQRVGPIAMSYFAIAYSLINSAGFPLIAGKTAAAQAAFGTQMQALAAQITWLLPLPQNPGTLGGFVQWRAYGFLAIVFPAWALLSAAGATRGDEGKGLVETWLASGLSRTRYLTARGAAFACVSGLALGAGGIATWIGGIVGSSPLDPARVLESSISLWALTLSCYGIALLLSQQTLTYRSAAGASACVLLVLFLLDSLQRSVSPSPLVGRFSVFSLNDRTTALAPSGQFDVAAVLILLAVALVTGTAAALAFQRRDLEAGLVRVRRHARTAHAPARNVLLGIPILRGLWQRRLSVAAWTAGASALAAFIVAIINGAAGLFTKTPSLQPFLRGLGGEVHVALLGLIWFALAQTLLSILAITYVWRWADEDTNGMLELQLSQPVSRVSVTFERAAELLVTLVVVTFVSSLVVMLVASANHITVGAGSMLLATVLLIPFALTFAAVGAVLAGFRPRLAVGVPATVSIASYLLFQLAPAFRWPAWVADLSVFQLYGTPLVQPVFVGGLVAMLVVVIAGFSVAGGLMLRREVGA
ncbi:MAG: hypothetical protein JOZ46_10180 [Candidatus Dormibacteraeota bacterium]|nr:hypothetical protein [Candidatus Dormibacteraeota bacterium]MBV9526165.1 hypothetical protein [Candidatus Dormibacteraeota bacterium]